MLGRRRTLRRQIALRIERGSAVADLEVQEHRIGAGAAHGADLLPRLHILAVAHQRGVVVRIGGNKVFAVLNRDQVAVAAQLVCRRTPLCPWRKRRSAGRVCRRCRCPCCHHLNWVGLHDPAAGRPTPTAGSARRRRLFGDRGGRRRGFTARGGGFGRCAAARPQFLPHFQAIRRAYLVDSGQIADFAVGDQAM